MIWVLTKRQQSQDGSKFKKWVFNQGVKGWTAELFQVWNIQLIGLPGVKVVCID